MYLNNVMNIPIEYRNAVDQLIDITVCKENIYGSKRKQWLTFHLPIYEIIVDQRKHYGVNNCISYEIEHPKFLILYEQHWPSKKKIWTWNDQQCEPNRYQRSETNFGVVEPGGWVTATYVGDLDEIANVAMFLWMTR